MRALLLAAGLGTRLKPLTDLIPKCLVPINGRPLLDYWLQLLFTQGIERALINTHHLADAVQTHIANSPWKDRVDLVNETALLGTGGTIAANQAYFKGEDFLVAHADNLTNFDLQALQNAHRSRPSNTSMTMLAFEPDDPTSCGILEYDAEGRVTAFHEKIANPPGNIANAAVYILTQEVVTAIIDTGRSDVDFSTEVIPKFMGRILAFKTSGYHRDIGTPESLRRAQNEFTFDFSLPEQTLSLKDLSGH